MEATNRSGASSDDILRTPSKVSIAPGVAPTKRRSSLINRARMSFVRSGGQRGASVETLRGTTGADFEAIASEVDRGSGSGVDCACFGDSGSDKNVVILIKGPFCFVYKGVSDAAPKYAISLSFMKSSVREPSHGRFPVTLETTLGDVEYELFFADKDTADLFARVVGQQASASESETIRKRLGHEHLLTKRASVRYAEGIAIKKVADQPETQMAANELINTVPMQF